MMDGPEGVVESEIVVEAAGDPTQYNVILDEDMQLQQPGERILNRDGLPVYSQNAPNFLESADLVLTGSDDTTMTCDSVPNHYFGSKCAYLLDLDKFRAPIKRITDVSGDAYGGWRAWGSKDMYFQETGAGDFVKIGGIGKKPPGADWDLLVHEYRLFHPQRDPQGGDGKLTKRIYAIFSDSEYKEITGRWVLIVYEWRGEPFEIAPIRKLPGKLGGAVAHRPSGMYAEMAAPMAAPPGSATSAEYPGLARGFAQKSAIKSAPRAIPAKKRKRTSGRQIFLPGEDEVEEDELLELEKEKLEREIEILDMQKIYLGLKIEKEQKMYEEQGQQAQNFPHETVQFVQVATSE